MVHTRGSGLVFLEFLEFWIFDCGEGRETLDEFLKLRVAKDMIIVGISAARAIIEDLKMSIMQLVQKIVAMAMQMARAAAAAAEAQAAAAASFLELPPALTPLATTTVGNGFLLPAGPLREQLHNIKNYQIAIINGKRNIAFEKKLTGYRRRHFVLVYKLIRHVTLYQRL